MECAISVLVFFTRVVRIKSDALLMPELEKKMLLPPTVQYVTNPAFKYTHFGNIYNEQSNAKKANSDEYPWIAAMYRAGADHPEKSWKTEKPYCTAICVDLRIFITSARCIVHQNVNLVYIVYRPVILYPLAFISPQLISKNEFDDIGFVVVKQENQDKVNQWKRIVMYFKNNRTDDNFNWFAKSDLKPNAKIYKAVGFAAEVYRGTFYLYELDVAIDIDLCVKFHTQQLHKSYQHYDGYHVPCFFCCTMTEWKNNQTCTSTLTANGGAVIVKHNQLYKLIGVMTWGTYMNEITPVGFSVPNSKNYYDNFKCATGIRDDANENVQKGYYQYLCDKL